MLDGAAVEHLQQLLALCIELLALLIQAQQILDFVEHNLVNHRAQVLVVLITHAQQLVFAFQQHVLEGHAALAADLPLGHHDPLYFIHQLLLRVRERLSGHVAGRRLQVVEIQVLAVVVEVGGHDLLDDEVDLLIDELHLGLLKLLEEFLEVEILHRLVLERPLDGRGDDVQVDALPRQGVGVGKGVLEEPRRQPAQALRLLARLQRVPGREFVHIPGDVPLLAANAVGPLHQGLIDLFLPFQVNVVGKVDLVDAAAQRLHDVFGDKYLILGIVAVADDHFIDMHRREAGQIDALGLNELQQERKQLAAALEDLGPVQDAPVGPDDLPLEVVGLGIEG